MVLWAFAAVGLVVALVAFAATRRLARKLDGLTQAYWELRYDYTRLRSQVAQLDPGQAPDPEPPPGASVSFVPLSSIRKKEQ